MGVSPWRTPYQLWEEKVFGIDNDSDSPAMKRGRDLEETARQEFERMMGTSVIPQNVVHLEKPWLRASLDGIDVFGNIVVEIKCPNKEDHFVALNKKVPNKYFPQVQHQLAVTDLDKMYYFSYDGSKGVIVEVKRDQQYIDELLAKEEEFWGLVVTQTPPELTDKDYNDKAQDPEWIKIAEEWERAKENRVSMEIAEKYAREKLIALSKGKNARCNKFILTKSICKGSVDYQKAIDEYIQTMQQNYPEVEFPPR